MTYSHIIPQHVQRSHRNGTCILMFTCTNVMKTKIKLKNLYVIPMVSLPWLSVCCSITLYEKPLCSTNAHKIILFSRFVRINQEKYFVLQMYYIYLATVLRNHIRSPVCCGIKGLEIHKRIWQLESPPTKVFVIKFYLLTEHKKTSYYQVTFAENISVP